jgi:AraC-like DNA-binding protein/ligand-binding sensor protein
MNMGMDTNRAKALAERISKSRLYQDYERAFSETTHLPLSFRPVQTWQLAQSGKKFENPFCALMAKTNRSCGMCLDAQQTISQPVSKTQSAVCFAGLTDTSVPVQLGDRVLGFLQTGQVALKQPTQKTFKKIAKQILDWGGKTDLKELEAAYFHTQVLTPKAYQSMVRLLEVFGQHISMAVDQIAVQMDNAEPPPIKRAKEFIEERKTENISMRDVAKVVNVSTFYFCKMFKKATGLTFTEYLSHVRISKAKNLLLNPNLRISEIAYDIGYQSLTHFNRTFHRIVGQSPSAYRKAVITDSL